MSVQVEATLDTIDQEVISRATALVPVLREYAAQGAADRRLAPQVIDALTEAGMFHLLLPARLGGEGASLCTVTKALAELARGDGSAAWVTNLFVSVTAFASTYTAQAQEDVFASNPKARISGTFTPGTSKAEHVEGGYRIAGRWPYSTGSFAADWASLGVLVDVPGSDEPAPAMALVPSEAFTIEPTWFVAGMKGTGSDTIVITDHFVPDHRVQLLPEMIAGNYQTPFTDEPLTSMSLPAVAGATSVAVHVGLIKHALEVTRAKLPEKPVAYSSFQQARVSPTHHRAVAEAATKAHLSELLLDGLANDLDRSGTEGRPLDLETRTRIRNDIGVAAQLADEAVGLLLTANGAGSFADANVLSRIWQDTSIITRHAYISPELGKEAYGRLLLGNLEPTMAL